MTLIRDETTTVPTSGHTHTVLSIDNRKGAFTSLDSLTAHQECFAHTDTTGDEGGIKVEGTCCIVIELHEMTAERRPKKSSSHWGQIRWHTT